MQLDNAWINDWKYQYWVAKRKIATFDHKVLINWDLSKNILQKMAKLEWGMDLLQNEFPNMSSLFSKVTVILLMWSRILGKWVCKSWGIFQFELTIKYCIFHLIFWWMWWGKWIWFPKSILDQSWTTKFYYTARSYKSSRILNCLKSRFDFGKRIHGIWCGSYLLRFYSLRSMMNDPIDHFTHIKNKE